MKSQQPWVNKKEKIGKIYWVGKKPSKTFSEKKKEKSFKVFDIMQCDKPGPPIK